MLDPTENLTVLINTGRPNNYGFADAIQLAPQYGPEYLDARHYLEPAAFRWLGLAYVYAPEGWAARLPARARHWLEDSRFFDVLARDGDAALYRVRPAFLQLETRPHPESFEALRDLPPATVVYLPPQKQARRKVDLLRVASALPKARLVGTISPERLHLWTPVPWQVDPLGAHVPSLVALPQLHEAWVYPPNGWREVWRNPPGRVALYAPSATADALSDAMSDAMSPLPSVRLADVQPAEERLLFTATLDARTPSEWTGQDWVLGPVDTSPWGIPILGYDGQVNIEQWFAGQAAVGATTMTHTYAFDARTSSLSVRGADGAFATAQSSSRTPEPGSWMLALRLTRQGNRGVQEIVAIVPALRFEVAADGTVASPQGYEPSYGWRPA